MDPTRTELMLTMKGRMQLAAMEAEAAAAAKKSDLANDPWFGPTARMQGKIDWDGEETISSQVCLDILEVPMDARRAPVFRRLTKMMAAHGWSPIRIRANAAQGGNITERIRGFSRRTNKLPHGRVNKDHPGKCQTDTPYVMSHVVGRLETDRRFALARSVRALVAERDTLQEKLAAANDFAAAQHQTVIDDAADDDFAEAQRLAETVLANDGDED